MFQQRHEVVDPGDELGQYARLATRRVEAQAFEHASCPA
jgi:hypothetical protein